MVSKTLPQDIDNDLQHPSKPSAAIHQQDSIGESGFVLMSTIWNQKLSLEPQLCSTQAKPRSWCYTIENKYLS